MRNRFFDKAFGLFWGAMLTVISTGSAQALDCSQCPTHYVDLTGIRSPLGYGIPLSFRGDYPLQTGTLFLSGSIIGSQVTYGGKLYLDGGSYCTSVTVPADGANLNRVYFSCYVYPLEFRLSKLDVAAAFGEGSPMSDTIRYQPLPFHIVSPENNAVVVNNASVPICITDPFWSLPGTVICDVGGRRVINTPWNKDSQVAAITSVTTNDFAGEETLLVTVTALDRNYSWNTASDSVLLQLHELTNVPALIDYTENDPVAPYDGSTRSFAQHDLVLKDAAFGIDFFRTYDSTLTNDGPFGVGWTHTFDQMLELQGYTALLRRPDGQYTVFLRNGTLPYYTSYDEEPLCLTRIAENHCEMYDNRQRVHTFLNGRLVRIADNNGNDLGLRWDANRLTCISNHNFSLALAYNAGGHITSVCDSAARTCSYTYANGLLSSATDVAGQQSQFSYDTSARMISHTRADGAAVSYVYDAQGRCTNAFLSSGYLGGAWQYQSTTQPRITVSWDALGAVLTNTFTARGLLKQMQFSDGTTRSYSHQGIRRTSLTDENGNTTIITLKKGQVTSRTDARGAARTFTYQPVHQRPGLLTQIQEPDGGKTAISYDGRTNVVSVERGITAGQPQSQFLAYDANGQLCSSWDALGHATSNLYSLAGWLAETRDPLKRATRFAYDARGNVTNIINPRGFSTMLAYDVFDRPVLTVNPDGGTQRIVYDKAGRVVTVQNALGAVLSNCYNVVGLPTIAIDPLSNRVEQTHDLMGRPTTRTIVDASDNSHHTYSNIYNARGRLVRQIDPLGHATAFGYDKVGNLIAVTNAQGAVSRFFYDKNYNLIAAIDPLGRTNSIVYDAANRVTSRTNAIGRVVDLTTYDILGRLTSAKAYDSAPASKSFVYDAASRLVSSTVQSPAGTMQSAMSYDAADQLVTATDPAGYSNTLSYDAAGNLIRHVNENSAAAAYTYDAMNQLSCVTDPLGTWWSNAYDQAGRVLAFLPSYSSNDTFTCDALGRVTAWNSPAGNVTRAYNAPGQVTTAFFSDGRSNLYNYDAAFRLTDVSQSSILPPFQSSVSYTHDALGNLTSESHTSSTPSLQYSLTHAYDAANQRTGLNVQSSTAPLLRYSSSCAYDPLGRLSRVSNDFLAATYAYDIAGNLTGLLCNVGATSVSRISAYDALDRLTSLQSSIQSQATSIVAAATAYTYEPKRSLIASIRDLNGNVQVNRYDPAGQLLGVDNIGYHYDAAGRITQVWTNYPSLIAYWSFEDPANLGRNDANNDFGLSFDNNIKSSSTALPYINGQCRVNTGRHSRAVCYKGGAIATHAPALNTTNFTFAGYFYYTYYAYSWEAFGQRSGLWAFGMDPQAHFFLNVGNSNIYIPGAQSPNWYHLALVRNGDTFTYYTNGVCLTNITYPGLGPLTNSSDLLINPSDQHNSFMDEVYYFGRALTPSEIERLYNDNDDTLALAQQYIYASGNQLATAGGFSNATAATLDIVCNSPLPLTNWLVEANSVPSISSAYANATTSFLITNIPLRATCAWAKVTLDGRSAVAEDSAGWSAWGMHQPATNNQLHFKVEPTVNQGVGVFPVAPVTNASYTYDPAGQLLSRTVAGAGGPGSVFYAYDAARNMTACHGQGFTNEYFYDHARRLIFEAHTGPDGVRSNHFVYDGMDVIAKVDEVSGEMVYFTRGLGIAPGVGDVLAETHINGSLTQTYIYVSNHRGDTVALVDATTGEIVGRYEYDAWGNVVSHSGQDAYFTFSSKHYDENAGLYYYGYRWYDPVAKRWTQPDPEGLSEGLDLYRFCGNDPINNVDLYGLDANDVHRVVGPSGGTHLILIGRNNKNPSFFPEKAEILSKTIQGKVKIVLVTSRSEFNSALMSTRDINGLTYLGHAGYTYRSNVGNTYALMLSQEEMIPQDVLKLNTENLWYGAEINLIGCQTSEEIAKAFADHFQRTVWGSQGGVSWGYSFPPDSDKPCFTLLPQVMRRKAVRITPSSQNVDVLHNWDNNRRNEWQ